MVPALLNVDLAQESIQERSLWKNQMEEPVLERIRRFSNAKRKNALVGIFSTNRIVLS